MRSAPLPRDEDARLAALRAYEILDTRAEADFDEIARLAAQVCKVPFAAIGLVDAERTWFKAQVGFDDAETARTTSFCAHAILGDVLFAVENAVDDERFRDHPMVAGEPHVRFYAGVPLITPEGRHVGAICIADTEPRKLKPEQAEALRWLGRHTVMLLELRRQESILRTTASLSRSPKPVDTTDRWRFWPAVLALVGGLLLTALAARIAHGLAMRGEEERFAGRADRIAATVAQRLSSDVRVMDAAAALWTPKRAPAEDEWDRFFKAQVASGRYRGLVGLGFVEAQSDTAYVIGMVAPVEVAKAGLGRNIALDPGRRTTAEKARDEGRPAMTPPTNYDGTQLNTIVYRAIYRAGMPLDTVGQRRAALIGWIYALVRVSDLGGDQLPSAPMHFQLRDGGTVMVAAGTSTQPLPFRSERRMTLLGRDWTISLDGSPDARVVARETEMVLVAGVPITILLVVMVMVLNSTRRRALAIAGDMTRGLRDSELRLRSIVDHIADAVIAFHDDGTLAAFNPAAERLFGYAPSAIIGKDVATILPTISEAAADGTTVQTRARRSDGREIPVELAINPVPNDDRNLTVAILRDISERVANEERLRASEERLESLIENADDVIYRADARGRFTFVNTTASRVTGYDKHRLMGMSYLNLVRPDYSDAVRRFYELQHYDKVANSYLEFPIIAADGREMWLGQKVQPVFENGEIVGYHGLARDVTDRKRLKDELELARDAALESARLKSQFLATMSHEIRTPMNGVIGMLGLLLETELTEEQREIATTVQKSADSLLTIINDILDYSKIESGKLIFERNEFDLVEVVDGSVDLLAEQARAKSLDIAVLIDENVPTRLRGDAGRLRQVLINLIGNAVKFTEAGSIVVSATTEEESGDTVVLRFMISDSGIGIEPEVVGRLFRPFVQADGTMARRFGGTGLGLAICKQLVEQMNGAIGVESEPGRGSTFWFTAELEKQPEAQPEPSPLEARAVTADEPAQPRRMRVLVAEDNQVNQKVVVSQLRKLGHTAVAVGNGLEALAALDEIDYDAVLMDCQMPEMDGYEATSIIRGRLKYKKLPIIAMTANAMAGDRERCLDAGMDDYLTKPFKVEQLAQVLSRVALEPEVPEPSASDDSGVLDESVLEELRSIDASDPAFVSAVIALYLQEAPARVDAVRQAIAAGNKEAMWRAAHAFKGACANVGARRLAEVCATIERHGRNGDAGDVSALLETLESEYRGAVAALERAAQ